MIIWVFLHLSSLHWLTSLLGLPSSHSFKLLRSSPFPFLAIVCTFTSHWEVIDLYRSLFFCSQIRENILSCSSWGVQIWPQCREGGENEPAAVWLLFSQTHQYANRFLSWSSHRFHGVVPHLRDQRIELCQTVRANWIKNLWCTGTVPARGENPTDQNTAFTLREQQPLLIALPHRVQLLCVTTQLQTQIPSWLLARFPQCLTWW